MAEERVQRRPAAILAADVVGYSRLIEVDDEGTCARLRNGHSGLKTGSGRRARGGSRGWERRRINPPLNRRTLDFRRLPNERLHAPDWSLAGFRTYRVAHRKPLITVA